MANYLAGFRTSNCCIGLAVLVKPFVHASTWSWLRIPLYLPRYHVTWFCNILKVFFRKEFPLHFILVVLCENHLCTWIYGYSIVYRDKWCSSQTGHQACQLWNAAPGPEIWKDMASNKHFCPLLCNSGSGEQKASTFTPNVGVFNLCHCHFSSKIRCLFIPTDCWLSSHIFPDSICLANMKWYFK